MIEIKNIEILTPLKKQYLTQNKAPLDGMWLCGFLPISTHFGVYDDTKLIGYYCIQIKGT